MMRSDISNRPSHFLLLTSILLIASSIITEATKTTTNKNNNDKNNNNNNNKRMLRGLQGSDDIFNNHVRRCIQYKDDDDDIISGCKNTVKDVINNAGGTITYEFDRINSICLSIPNYLESALYGNSCIVMIENDPERHIVPNIPSTDEEILDLYVHSNVQRSGGSNNNNNNPISAALESSNSNIIRRSGSSTSASNNIIRDDARRRQRRRKLSEEDSTNDPYLDELFGLNIIQAKEAWSIGQRGEGIKVCIIDSGLNVNHEDFIDKYNDGKLSGKDDKETGKWSEDVCNHGTHIAGTIAATDNNGKGVAGVAPDASLVIMKVFDSTCQWSSSSTLIQAVYDCIDLGANIINMSLGSDTFSKTEKAAFTEIYDNDDVLLIAAAGNAGNDEYNYPASHESVISVSAVKSDGKTRASFSQYNDQVEISAFGVAVLSTTSNGFAALLEINNEIVRGESMVYSPIATVVGTIYGDVDDLCDDSTSEYNNKIVLCKRGNTTFQEKVMTVKNGGGIGVVIYNNVPDEQISGTLGESGDYIPVIAMTEEDGLDLLTNYVGYTATLVHNSQESSYEFLTGTSMATPHVAGAAALVWGSKPDATAREIREVLKQTAYDPDNIVDNQTGYGTVKAYDAIQYINSPNYNYNPVTSEQPEEEEEEVEENNINEPPSCIKDFGTGCLIDGNVCCTENAYCDDRFFKDTGECKPNSPVQTRAKRLCDDERGGSRTAC